ncbi:FHA domain-containing protein [Streptomyces sp. Tu102]|uniref:FHA domain-containing protein n=1 Tax=Streptomyces TaxID=1883 RepID=UPI001BDDC2CB|nr:FHA domain-containing protein [Streptomyces sp. Tu102]MBT1092189.1 FHA domain-containing protein [Streptomyces sp. Tu102]
MPTCPNGHQSGSDDWCEVCGHRMAGAVPPPPPPPPPPGGGYGFPPPGGPGPGGPGPGGPSGGPNMGQQGGPPPMPGAREPELCPQCRTPREGGAPFCEECRWNFLTNTATSYTPAAPRPPAPGGPGLPSHFQQQSGPPPSFGGGDSYEYQGSRPSQVNRPAEPIPPFGADPHAQGGPGGPGQGPGGHGGPGGPGGFGPGPGAPGGPGATNPGAPGGPGFPGQGPGGPGAPGGPGPGAPGGPGGHGMNAPSAFGGDPSRQGPPPPPPGHGGPGGAPQAFQPAGPGPSAPQAPPGFGQDPNRPPQGGPSFGGGDDDWVISPPSSGPGGPGAPGAPPQGGYGYPQPGANQAPPPGPGYQQQPATWLATIGPDREYFMAMMHRSGPEAAGLNLPAYSPEQQRTLTGNQVTIGRRRHSTGDTPDIDLSVPPEDPGVSHQHAVLVQQPDGTWAVVDQNSTNGTTVNGSEEPIQPFVPVPLQDGDRVHVGAWTTITIRRG